MIIATYFYVQFLSGTTLHVDFVFNSLLEVKQFLSHYYTTQTGTLRIQVFKIEVSVNSSGNISTSQIQITSW